MDARLELLNQIKREGWAHGNFLGLLNVLIGRRIERENGTVISTGVTWRELAALLKKVRWDKDVATELSLEGVTLPPREREKYWYAVIVHAGVGLPRAIEAGNQLAEKLRKAGFVIGESPGC